MWSCSKRTPKRRGRATQPIRCPTVWKCAWHISTRGEAAPASVEAGFHIAGQFDEERAVALQLAEQFDGLCGVPGGLLARGIKAVEGGVGHLVVVHVRADGLAHGFG